MCKVIVRIILWIFKKRIKREEYSDGYGLVEIHKKVIFKKRTYEYCWAYGEEEYSIIKTR